MISVAASRAEQRPPMPSDRLVREPMFLATHAITKIFQPSILTQPRGTCYIVSLPSPCIATVFG